MPTKTRAKPVAETPDKENFFPHLDSATNKGSFFQKSSLVWVLLALAVLALGFFVWQNQKLKNNVAALESRLKNQAPANQTSPDASTAQVNKDLIASVGKLIILPSDEQPTIATVTDLEKLKGQPFFQNAAVGDKVLIYANAQKAILYRPSEDKIIELAPLNIGSDAAGSQSQQLKVEIRNGSGTPGAGAAFKTKLSGNTNFSIVKVANAKTTYPKTLLYAANPGKFPNLVNSLKQTAGAEIVATLPPGEPATSADALLILGQQ